MPEGEHGNFPTQLSRRHGRRVLIAPHRGLVADRWTLFLAAPRLRKLRDARC
jgi:hypothetical protein